MKRKIILSSALISFIIFALLLSHINLTTLVTLQSDTLKTAILGTQGMTTMPSIFKLLAPFTNIFLALIFLTLGLTILSLYGIKGQQKNALIIGLIASVCITVIFHSLLSVFISIGIIIPCIYIVPLSQTYDQELKKWKEFRIGSTTVSRALMVFNIILVVGIFVSVQTNLPAYESTFTQQFTGLVTNLTTSMMTNEQKIQDMVAQQYPRLPEQQKQELVEQFKNNTPSAPKINLQDSALFKAYIRWLPAITAFTVWVLLEFLRTIILSPISGLISKSLYWLIYS